MASKMRAAGVLILSRDHLGALGSWVRMGPAKHGGNLRGFGWVLIIFPGDQFMAECILRARRV